MAFEAKVVDLDGLRVVLVKDDRQSVTVRALVGSGSREEDDAVAGVSHFLEHYVFKGTKKFPGIFDVMEVVETVGGAQNAYTSNSEIGFWVKTDKDKLDLAVRVIGQLVTEPLLPPAHFKKERGTILEELKRYEDMPDSKAFEALWSLHFGENNLGRPIIGTRESLARLKPADLRTYMGRWFVKSNVIVGVVGNFEEKELLDMIRREFAGLINGTKQLPAKFAYHRSQQKEKRLKLISQKTEQTQLVIGFNGLPIGHPSRWAMHLTNIILGGGVISRLFREVREKKGWAYSIGSGTESFVDTGTFLISAGLVSDKIKEAVDLILAIVMGTTIKGKWRVTQKELDIAKGCYQGRVSLNFDRPEKVLGYALDDLMFEDKIYTPEELKEQAEKVTLDDINEVCKLIFKPENMSLVILGDYEKMPIEI